MLTDLKGFGVCFSISYDNDCSSLRVWGASANKYLCVTITETEIWLISLYVAIVYRFAPLALTEDLVMRRGHLL